MSHTKQQESGELSAKASLHAAHLSEDQKAFFKEIISRPRDNFFITGAGGSGKTVLMRALIDYYQDIEPKSHTEVVALMGITASRIFGSTIHSAFKIPPHYDYENGDDLCQPRNTGSSARRVFVDEVSMVSARLLAHIHSSLGGFDSDKRAFGGRQMIMFGDFAQLPPVMKSQANLDAALVYNWGGELVPDSYCFLGELWKRSDINVRSLREPLRQTDAELQRLLEELRFGRISTRGARALLRCVKLTPGKSSSSGDATIIMGKNLSVSQYNTKQYRLLTSPEYVVRGQFTWYNKNRQIDFRDERIENMWAESLNVSSSFKIRVGMLIMFRVSDKSCSIFNGTQAIITKIRVSESDPTLVESVDVSRLASGFTDLVTIKPWGASRPVYDRRAGAGTKILKYTNFMFCPAWAITVHKSQGATLDKVVSNLTPREMFLAHQAYVVASRVRNLADLELDDLDFSVFRSDALVTDFYKTHNLVSDDVVDLPEPDDLDVDVMDLCGLSIKEPIRNPVISQCQLKTTFSISEYGVYAIFDEGIFSAEQPDTTCNDQIKANTTIEEATWSKFTDFIAPVFVERSGCIYSLELVGESGRRVIIDLNGIRVNRVVISGYVIKTFSKCKITGKGSFLAGVFY